MSKLPNKTSAQNALRHGIYSSEVVLPWENAEEFLAFQTSVLEELSPRGTLEEEIAFDAVRLMWLKRRVRRAYQAPFLSDPLGRALADVKDGGWPAIAAKLEEKAKATRSLVMTGSQMLDAIKAKIGFDTLYERQQRERDNAENPAADSQREPSMFDRVHRSADLDRMLKTEAALDARIEKAIARLAGAKEYKRLYAETKTIEDAQPQQDQGEEPVDQKQIEKGEWLPRHHYK